MDRDTLLAKSPYQEAMALAANEDVEKAITFLSSHPGPSRDLVLHFDQMFSNLQRYSEWQKSLSKTSSNAEDAVELASFGQIPIWTPNTSLILFGATELGKTTLAKKCIDNYLFVRHMDHLKSFSPMRHGGIIFDDMAFLHLHREAQIHLADVQDDSQIHIRYKIVSIPKHTMKIFTTNKAPHEIFLLHDEAVARRFCIWRMITRTNIVMVTGKVYCEMLKSVNFTIENIQ